MGWQPIETAPKDGTRIIIYVAGQINDEPTQIAQWAEWSDETPFLWVTDQGEGFFSFNGWMPLPEPSKTESEGE